MIGNYWYLKAGVSQGKRESKKAMVKLLSHMVSVQRPKTVHSKQQFPKVQSVGEIGVTKILQPVIEQVNK